MFFFKLVAFIIRKYYKFFRIFPKSGNFISGDAFASLATYHYKVSKSLPVKPEIIFLETCYLEEFISNLRNIKKKFILITHNSDLSINSSYKKLINSPYLVRWYCANCEIKHQKVIGIPLGIQNYKYYSYGVPKHLKSIKKLNIKKQLKILVSFNIYTNIQIRITYLKDLISVKFSYLYLSENNYEYKIQLAKCMFCACPKGNGVDTYRFWEALYLGTIPIVDYGKFYDQFGDLPKLDVKSISDLNFYNKDSLIKIFKQQKKKLNDSEQIYFNFWKKKILLEYENIISN
jgi:hypothetical protein